MFNRTLFLVCILIIGCNKTNDRYALFYETYDVENPGIIQLDSPIQNLTDEEFELISKRSDTESFLGNGNVTEAINDSILIVIEQYNRIKKVNVNKGIVEKELYSVGRGPGEYEKINDIIDLESSFIIADREASKIIEYDYDLNFLNEWILSDFDANSHGSRIEYEEKILFYPIKNNEDYLFASYHLDSKVEKKGFFHKRLIPIAKQPRTYNEFIVRVQDDKKVAVSTLAPIFIEYDKNLNAKKVYKLDLNGIDKTESKEQDGRANIESDRRNVKNPDPQIIDGNIGVSFDGFKIFDVVLTEKKLFLYFSNRYIQERYLIVLENSENKWVHYGSYRFYLDKDEMYTVFDMAYKEPWLYLSSQFEKDILRIDVNELE